MDQQNFHHTKYQEALKLNEKSQSIDANTKMTEIWELLTKILRQPS